MFLCVSLSSLLLSRWHFILTLTNPTTLLSLFQEVADALAQSHGTLPGAVPVWRGSLLGACLADHVVHGAFVSSLQVGQPLELLSARGTWAFGSVAGLKRDGPILRAVKVQAHDSFLGDCVWVSVEDGRLAPLATNLPQPPLQLQ